MADEASDVKTTAESSDVAVSTNPEENAPTPDEDKPESKSDESKEEQDADSVFQIVVKLPHEPYEIQIMVSTQEQVQDLRASIVELPSTFQYSCFHLEHNSERINDFVELSEVKDLAAGSELKLVEDPYTEKEARLHMVRVRELIGAAGDRVDTLHGISAGLSLHDTVVPPEISDMTANGNGKSAKPSSLGPAHAMVDYDFNAPASVRTLLPKEQDPAPKTVKAISVSAWNPPPHHLRQQGHLLYLQVTTNEGEQYQITSHVSGFFVNKSSNSKFDPFPRPPPKNASAHSLFNLIANLSPSFITLFSSLQEFNGTRDPLTTFQPSNALAANPWLVAPATSALSAHQPDLTRTQETYLVAGIDNTETLRDWNEEFQSTRELPRETVQDRVFRERLTSKLFADYNEAAAKGAVLVARGEVAPLNPTESRDAQIFVYNNVFFSFGADGVGTFTTEGGDEAARVAVGKDLTGVMAVNQLDIAGLFTPGTIVVDYMGRRLVGQSIVPGIFKQREPGENQIDYGGVEGRDVVAENEAFVPVFSKLSKALRVKKHAVWDKEGKKHVLEGSVETKGLLGTDGRRYVLDLYRLTPLDISWLEQHWSEPSEEEDSKTKSYPHRMTVLRPELIDAYWRLKMGDYVKEEVEKRRGAPKDVKAVDEQNGTEKGHSKVEGPGPQGADESSDPNGEATNGVQLDSTGEAATTNDDNVKTGRGQERVDISGFSLALNPDVFCGQVPQSDEEKEEWSRDEQEVRAVCDFLLQKVLPELAHDLREGEVGFPMDGLSMSRLMHKRGINIRYLGQLATLAREQGSRLQALNALAVQEMVARAFKHIANRHMKDLPVVLAGACLAHLLNCLLGTGLNELPKAQVDEDLNSLYTDAECLFTKVTPNTLRSEIQSQVQLRYRYNLDDDWASAVKHVQLLREVALKLGLQLKAKDYEFVPRPSNSSGSDQTMNGDVPTPITNGHNTSGASSKKKKKNGDHITLPSNNSIVSEPPVTFVAEDVLNIVPIVKDACPRSTLAEEALEAGRISMMQNQRELGQELLLESLSLHEQIYGILHPEVARVYHQLSMLYYQLDEKNAAVELARKAVIVSERTLGIDSNETILSYLNLGLFEHANNNTNIALSYIRHALELWKVIYGLKHPDSITTINNAAVMLQNLKHYHESRLWFETSLAISEEVSGKQSVNTATLSFQLAQALALDQDPKGAVNRMRDAYNVFLARLGPDDRNTKESESWLEQLTQNAVQIAKHAKDLQARKIRRVQFNPKVTLATRPQPQVGQSPSDAANGRDPRNAIGLDSRSIDELMKFIEEGGETSKRSPAKKRSNRNNPKRRGGAMLGAQA